jgi:nucleoside-diphosphate-sugar epimerase
MKVMVIGGSGYLGRPIVRRLREQVDTISIGHHPGDGIDEHIEMSRGEDVNRLFRQAAPDVVVVTAYRLHHSTNADPVRAVETNLLGVTHIFQAAADFGVRRVILAGSGTVQGEASGRPGQLPDESTPARPTSLYGRMKLFNEWLAEHYNDTFGTEIVSYRISGPYGNRKSVGTTGGEIPFDTVVAAAANQTHVVLPWAADTRFRFIHVEDAACSFLPLILAPRLEHRIYNSPGFVVSVRELADAARAVSGLVAEFTDPGRPVPLVEWNSTRYEREFEFRPRPLQEWLPQEIAELRATAAGEAVTG